jgi:hypothetical protein
MLKKPSQLERLLKALQDHPEGLTNVEIINMYILNYKGRITDLRQGRLNHTNYNIKAVKPAQGNVWRYILGPTEAKRFKIDSNGQMAFIF